jgi:hypothetical protein
VTPGRIQELNGEQLLHDFEYGDRDAKDTVRLEVSLRTLGSLHETHERLAEVGEGMKGMAITLGAIPPALTSLKSSVDGLKQELASSAASSKRLTTAYTIATWALALFALVQVIVTFAAPRCP